MNWLTAKLAGYGAAIGGVLLGILYIFNSGKKSARNKIKLDTMKTKIDVMEKNEVIDEKIDNTSDDELRKRMRRDHSSNH